MILLLDTCTFLWIVADSPDLSPRARQLFADPENDVFLSAASAWEIIVKNRMGKLPLPGPVDEFIRLNRTRHRIESLPIGESATFQLSRLPDYHKDPFDRMLICQAIAGSMTILTPDRHITSYPVRTDW